MQKADRLISSGSLFLAVLLPKLNSVARQLHRKHGHISAVGEVVLNKSIVTMPNLIKEDRLI